MVWKGNNHYLLEKYASPSFLMCTTPNQSVDVSISVPAGTCKSEAWFHVNLERGFHVNLEVQFYGKFGVDR